jgi:hypothetical protein
MKEKGGVEERREKEQVRQKGGCGQEEETTYKVLGEHREEVGP